MKSSAVIGVLALQGAVEPHKAHIDSAGGEFRAVKTPEQFDDVDAIILPGGESTTMLRLIETFGLWDALEEQFKTKPVWGICAGAILLAERVINPQQKSFGLLPIEVQRNAYGRQLDSHYDDIDGFNVSFIRAPVVTDPGNCEILARQDDRPVWLLQGTRMITTFHPELTQDFPSPMHKRFVDMVSHSA